MSFRKLALRGAALAVVFSAGFMASGTVERATADVQEGPIYEVRNYHFDPARFDEYAVVARGEYLRYLREHLDIVGFWIGTDIPSEVRGVEQDELGPANITWIIRWESKAERDDKLPQVLGTPEWREIFAEVPGGGASYLRIESRFMESLF